MRAPRYGSLPKSLKLALRMAPAMAAGVVVAALLIPNWATSAPSATQTLRFVEADDAAVSAAFPRQRLGSRRLLRVGGPARWRSYVRFRVRGVSGKTVRRAELVVFAKRPVRARLLVRLAIGRRGWRERRVRAATAPRQGAIVARHFPGRRRVRISFNVTRAVRKNGRVGFVLTSPSRRLLRLKSSEALVGRPRLLVRGGDAGPHPCEHAPAGQPDRPLGGPGHDGGVGRTGRGPGERHGAGHHRSDAARPLGGGPADAGRGGLAADLRAGVDRAQGDGRHRGGHREGVQPGLEPRHPHARHGARGRPHR